ncbi:MAG: MerR family transcriptional regulator [Bacteroidales bacterium]|nr:MerR family transcriptional regulator [Bacteroidales bacterium]
MKNYSIKDLEKLTGIKAHTIRIWEKRYDIVEPKRTTTNIRYYNDDDLKRLLNVSILNRHGFKISHIARMDTREMNQKVLEITSDSHDFDSQIENLVVAMIELDETKFEKALSTAIIKLGFEDTITRIVYPFFNKIGTLWQIGTVTAAQEHFVSNLIRQKLIIAIDGVVNTSNPNPKTFVLFLPNGEWHEMGLLFIAYKIKKEGHKIIYLGQSVPFDDLKEVVDIQAPQILVTGISSSLSKETYEDYIKRLSNAFPDRSIYVSGYQASEHQIKLPRNVHTITSMDELKEELEKLRR